MCLYFCYPSGRRAHHSVVRGDRELFIEQHTTHYRTLPPRHANIQPNPPDTGPPDTAAHEPLAAIRNGQTTSSGIREPRWNHRRAPITRGAFVVRRRKEPDDVARARAEEMVARIDGAGPEELNRMERQRAWLRRNVGVDFRGRHLVGREVERREEEVEKDMEKGSEEVEEKGEEAEEEVGEEARGEERKKEPKLEEEVEPSGDASDGDQQGSNSQRQHA